MNVPLNPETAKKLRMNPHYKPTPGQIPPAYFQDESVRTFGVPPAQHTIIPKHPTEPKTITHKKKKKIDNENQ